jgi:SAM-dependent methyltransferase
MSDQLEEVKCAICGKDETDLYAVGADPWRIVKCRNDGLIYKNPRPTLAGLRAVQMQIVPTTNPDWYTYRQTVMAKQARVMETLRRGGNLLDVGCATGAFFESFAPGKWHFFGVDISPVGLETARKKYHAEVFCGTLREAQFPSGFFDLVTVMDCLYYFPDPHLELAEIWRILKNDGLLAVEIPGLGAYRLNEKGLLCRLLHGKWVRGFLSTPARTYFFSPRAIRLMLNRVGFQVVNMSIYRGLDMGRRGWVQALHGAEFALATLLFNATGGRVSMGGRELYLAMKTPSAPGVAEWATKAK